MQGIYLDHNATTPLLPEVAAVMGDCPFGNPSSLHSFGQEARRALDHARTQVATFLGAHPDEIIFTSGGTEADNLALGAALPLGRLVISAVEHSAVREPAAALAKTGFPVAHLPVDAGGRVDPAALPALLNGRQALVSVMMANHEVGTLQPVATLGTLVHDHHGLMHTDAVQAAGRVPLDVKTLGVDLLSLSAHKLGGPRGTGALYVRRGVNLAPLLRGGPQEHHLRAGTENLPGILGFGCACAMAMEHLTQRIAHIQRLRDLLAQRFEAFPGFRRHGDPTHTLPNTLHVRFDGVMSEAMVLGLDLEGVAVSSGAACASESREPSPVLLAMGLSEADARGGVRFSLGEANTEEDISRTVEAVSRVLGRLTARGSR